MIIPVLPTSVLSQAKAVWKDSIAKFGQTVEFRSNVDDSVVFSCRAFCKRPKILGLFDRTEQSYDQERHVVIVDADDFAGVDPVKFDRVTWLAEEHAVLSVTPQELMGVVFGYRFLVKG